MPIEAYKNTNPNENKNNQRPSLKEEMDWVKNQIKLKKFNLFI